MTKRVTSVRKQLRLTNYFRSIGWITGTVTMVKRKTLAAVIRKNVPVNASGDMAVINAFYESRVPPEGWDQYDKCLAPVIQKKHAAFSSMKDPTEQVLKMKEKRLKGSGFYLSAEWKALRYKALVVNGSICSCCGAAPSDGVRMHVDHIKPRAKYPELALELSNLQVLCSSCNEGKGAWDETDWRSEEAKMNEQYRATLQ